VGVIVPHFCYKGQCSTSLFYAIVGLDTYPVTDLVVV